MNKLILTFLGLLCLNLHAQISLTESLIESEINLAKDQKIKIPKGPLLIVSAINSNQFKSILNLNYLNRILYRKLKKKKIQSIIYEGDFQVDLKQKKVSLDNLLLPKLVLDIHLEAYREDFVQTVNYQISLIEFKEDSKKNDTILPRVLWKKQRGASQLSKKELEAYLLRNVQADLEAVKNRFNRRTVRQAVSRGSEPNTKSSSYEVKWTDPRRVGEKLLLGLGTGYPLIANVSAYYWGEGSFPLMVGLSGGYINTEHRGGFLDVGYIFDNEGEYRQAVALRGAVLNTNEEIISETRDVLGAVSLRTLSKNQELKGYIGPSYTLRYSPMMGSASVLASPTTGNLKILIQLSVNHEINL